MHTPTHSLSCPRSVLFQGGGEVSEAGHNEVISNVQGTADDSEHGVRPLGLDLLGDEAVQPASSDVVGLVLLSLQQLRQVLHRRAKVTADRQLLQRHH